MIWTANIDGGCRDNPGPGAWGGVIRKPDEIQEVAGFLTHCTNNQAEYRALEAVCLTILGYPPEERPQQIQIFSDSQLVVNQINGAWRVNDLILPFYKTAVAAFRRLRVTCSVTLTWVRRDENSAPDALCNRVMDRHGVVCSKKGKPRDRGVAV